MRRCAKAGTAATGLLLVLPLVLGCGRAGWQPPGGPLGPGAVAPELPAEAWLNGPAPSKSDLVGKVVVIDVWAYWCGPCRAATPGLVQTYQRYRQRDVVFVGLTAEDATKLDDIRDFIERYGISWPNAYHAQATIAALGVQGYPTVFVVGADGRIAWNDYQGGSLQEAIDAALTKAGRI